MSAVTLQGYHSLFGELRAEFASEREARQEVVRRAPGWEWWEVVDEDGQLLLCNGAPPDEEVSSPAMPRRAGPPPEPTTVAHQAVVGFHTAAVEILRAMGKPDTNTAIAELVGETPQNYGNAVHGRSGSLDRVRDWMHAWRAAGLPELELVVTADSALIRRRERP